MVTTDDKGGFYARGTFSSQVPAGASVETGRDKTMAWKILEKHNHSGDRQKLKLRFDSLASHDITYVGIIQTARASGMKEFPMPYVLTNCHNSLCAVGGTINEDDHLFGLSAAQKYGGDFVPAHLAVIHQYVREVMAGCGKMILGSDSHTRFGALGTLAIGEGGPELVKQLLNRYYEVSRPEVAAVYMTGSPRPGVGPQDVALAIIKAVFSNGLVKNRVMEFFGPGVTAISTEYRIGIDVMTTETTCLSSIWQTDERVRRYLAVHGREAEYAEMGPEDGAYYDKIITVDLSKIEPMIALPFHPSNAHTVREFLDNAADLLHLVEKEACELVPNTQAPNLLAKLRGHNFYPDQAIIAGCSGGGFENITQAARLLKGSGAGSPMLNFAVYPSSQPVFLEVVRQGSAAALMEAGAILRSAFCGPCFGAGDVPGNHGFSIRHTTRNFPNRDGSQPGAGQMSFVALMDARSIAATVLNKGALIPATELEWFPEEAPGLEDVYHYDPSIYSQKVYHGWKHPKPQTKLVFGPNIADWPAMQALPENIVLQVASAIYDPVTTTDELIPSGETSSYRSNPLRLSEYALSRKDPAYVGRAKQIKILQDQISAGKSSPELNALCTALHAAGLNTPNGQHAGELGIGSVVFALKPGDGSAREQAASCQKVLGGWANIAQEYATKRYRSNLINWGMLPLLWKEWESARPQIGDIFYIPNVRQAVHMGLTDIPAFLVRNGKKQSIILQMAPLTTDERKILLSGCLINFYAAENAPK